MITLKQLYYAICQASFHVDGEGYTELKTVHEPKFLSLYMESKGRDKLTGNWQIKRIENLGEVVSKTYSTTLSIRKNCFIVTGYDAQFVTFDLTVANELFSKMEKWANKSMS